MTSGAAVATHMAEIGIFPHVIEATLNHLSGHKSGIAGVYNRATYDDERADALDKWAKHLRHIRRKHVGLHAIG